MIYAAAFIGSRAVADAGIIRSRGIGVVVGRVDGQRLGHAPNRTALASGRAVGEAAAGNHRFFSVRIKNVDRAAIVADVVVEGAAGDRIIFGRASHSAAIAVVTCAVEGVAVLKGTVRQEDPAVSRWLAGCVVRVARPHVERAAVFRVGRAVAEASIRNTDLSRAALHRTGGLPRAATIKGTAVDIRVGFSIVLGINKMEQRAALLHSRAGGKVAVLNGQSLHTGPDRAAAIFVCGMKRLTIVEIGIGNGQIAVGYTGCGSNGFYEDTAAVLCLAVVEVAVFNFHIPAVCVDDTVLDICSTEVLAVEDQVFQRQLVNIVVA